MSRFLGDGEPLPRSPAAPRSPEGSAGPCRHGMANLLNCPRCNGKDGAARLAAIKRKPSVYEGRFAPDPARKIGRYDVVMGHVLPVYECCPDPIECHKPGCWKPWP